MDCPYLENQNCTAITDNSEPQEIRKIYCSNDNQQACCYQCKFQNNCEISCDYKNNEASTTPTKENKTKITLCPHCKTKMLSSNIDLRVGGWSGLKAFAVPFGQLSEGAQGLLPVTMYICPMCKKIEFMAQDVTVQKLITSQV